MKKCKCTLVILVHSVNKVAEIRNHYQFLRLHNIRVVCKSQTNIKYIAAFKLCHNSVLLSNLKLTKNLTKILFYTYFTLPMEFHILRYRICYRLVDFIQKIVNKCNMYLQMRLRCDERSLIKVDVANVKGYTRVSENTHFNLICQR